MINELPHKGILLRLFNNIDILETVLKFTDDDLKNFVRLLDWSPALISNVIKHDFVIFELLLKASVGAADLKSILTWSNTLQSQIKNTSNIFSLVNKISDADKANVNLIFGWPPELIAQLSKDLSLFEFLTKLSNSDISDLLHIFNWSPALVSIVARNKNLFKFINILPADDVQSFKTILTWSRSLLTVFKNTPDHLAVLYKIWDIVDDKNQFFDTYLKLCRDSGAISYDILDAFSNGQLGSKSWLIKELDSLAMPLGNVWILCGWIGSLAYLISNGSRRLNIDKLRSFDIDTRCAPLAEVLNKKEVLDNWRFKASTIDVNSMRFDNYKFATAKSDGTTQYIQESATTIINTSCDHMTHNTWWERIVPGTLVVLQNNDFIHIQDHVNTVTSLDEFKHRYPMTTILYEGELDCDLYTRYMLIGRK